MQLNDILSNAEDQDRGRWLELADPVTGRATGIRLRIAGPDSDTQVRSRLKLSDELADIADHTGRLPADGSDKARRNSLARCVLGWEIKEDGQPVPFNHANVVRLLRAAPWVEAQVDAFASNRAVFQGAE